MIRKLLRAWALVACAVTSFACGGSNQQSAASATTSAGTADGEAQAERGAKLYADNCAGCHGSAGQGSKKAPPVVGTNALPLDPRPEQKYRKAAFHTALDVAQFVVKSMPPEKPGSLPESDYWDILAFDLKANGVPVAGKHIDAQTAADIKLH
ncbi:c-type cytochrome [Pendulispora albinea]|uniref:C-type cytochrome n=1 Tax=Pendulispora albinea TaxID=2741071 RepID=A0ABZ2M7R0_9BACT